MRADEGQDPPGWQVEDTTQRKSLASNAYRLLDHARRVPGTDSEGGIDAEALEKWIDKARELCARYGRAEVGDTRIGQILSHAPSEKNGLWPCDAVCEALERFAVQHIRKGFIIGVHNTRGAHRR